MVRIYNNMHHFRLIRKYNLDGISVLVDGKYYRGICACGEVIKMDENGKGTCKACGNDNFSYLNRGWRHSSNDVVAYNDAYLEEVAKNVYEIVSPCLCYTEDLRAQSFDVYETNVVTSKIELGKIELKWAAAASIAERCTDAMKLLKELFPTIPDVRFQEKMAKVVEYHNILYKKDITEEDSDYMPMLLKMYNLMDHSPISLVVTAQNIEEYPVVFGYLLKIGKLDEKLPIGKKMFSSIHEVIKEMGIPDELVNFLKIKTNKHLSRERYHQPSIQVFDETKFASLIPELRRGIKYMFEHGYVTFDTFSEMCKQASTYTQEVQLLASKYIRKYGIYEGWGGPLGQFEIHLKQCKELNVPDEMVLNRRQIAAVVFTKLLEKRKFPTARVEAFFDCVDKDALYAVNLLTTKSRLKFEEQKKVMDLNT